MTDVFLSYARGDQDAAAQLVRFLEEQGFSVWWDRQISAGENWERKIEDAIRETRCAIVLWTPHSVDSDEVRAEARSAKNQRKILPVLLEDVEVPLSYQTIHYCDLRGWTGGEHPGLQDLCQAVTTRLTETAEDGGAAGQETKTQPGKLARVSKTSVAWLILPTVIVTLAVVLLMTWRTPTEVEVDVVARQVRLKGGDANPRVLHEATTSNSLALSGFSSLTLHPAEVSVADPARYDIETDGYPADAWSPLTASSALTIQPAQENTDATVTIEPYGASATPLSLSPLYVADAEVLLSSPEKDTLAVRLSGSPQKMEFSLPEEFQIDAAYCALSGVLLPYQAAAATLRVRLSDNRRILDLTPGEQGARLDIQSADPQVSYLARQAFPIKTVEFIDLGPTGEPASTITGSGTISYENYPNIAPIALEQGDYLQLGDLRDFYLLGIAPDGSTDSLHIKLHGIAGHISSGPKDYIRDRRLAQFEKLWQNSQLVALFTILAWLVATLVAGRKIYKEMRRA